MKRIIIFIITMLGACSRLALAQETPPPSQYLKSVNAQFYMDSRDSSVWHFKGLQYGWQKLGRYKDVAAKLDISDTTSLLRKDAAATTYAKLNSGNLFAGLQYYSNGSTQGLINGSRFHGEFGNINMGANPSINAISNYPLRLTSGKSGYLVARGDSLSDSEGRTFIKSQGNVSGLNLGNNDLTARSISSFGGFFGGELHVYQSNNDAMYPGKITFDSTDPSKQWSLSDQQIVYKTNDEQINDRSLVFDHNLDRLTFGTSLNRNTIAYKSDFEDRPDSATIAKKYINKTAQNNVTGSIRFNSSDIYNSYTTIAANGIGIYDGEITTRLTGNPNISSGLYPFKGLSLQNGTETLGIDPTDRTIGWYSDATPGSLTLHKPANFSSLTKGYNLYLPPKNDTIAVITDIINAVSKYPDSSVIANTYVKLAGGNLSDLNMMDKNIIFNTRENKGIYFGDTTIGIREQKYAGYNSVGSILNTKIGDFSAVGFSVRNFKTSGFFFSNVAMTKVAHTLYVSDSFSSADYGQQNAALYFDTKNKGVQFPFMTAAQRSAIPLVDYDSNIGLTVYQTDSGGDGAGLYSATTGKVWKRYAFLSDLNSRPDSVAIAGKYLAKTGGVLTGWVTLPNATPTDPLHPVPKIYFDNALTGITWKNAVQAKSNGNITLSGVQTIDGVSGLAGGRYLLNNQTNPAENGIWIMSAGAWTRATDADSGDEIQTSTVAVTNGTLNRNQQWTCLNTSSPAVGTDAISYGQISGAGTYAASGGIDFSGNLFTLNTAYVRGLFSATGQLSYNNATGAFNVSIANLSAGAGLNSTTYNGSAAQTFSINQAFAPTWTGLHTYQFNGLGTPTIDALLLQNSAPAALNAQQVSPSIHFSSNGWGTTAGTSQNIDWRMYSAPIQQGIVAGNLNFSVARNGGAYVDVATISNSGRFNGNSFASYQSGLGTTGGDGMLLINQSASTSSAPVQYSQRIRLQGTAWNTTTSASNTVDWISEVRPNSGSSVSSNFVWSSSNNGASYIDRLILSETGDLYSTRGIYATRGNFGATSNDGFVLSNGTSATSGTPVQYSNRLRFLGSAWNTSGTPASNSQEAIMELRPTSGTTTGATLALAFQNNSGGFNDRFTVSNTGLLYAAGGFQTATTSELSNFYAAGGSTNNINSSAAASLFGGSSAVNYRAAFSGATGSAIAANYNYANLLVGASPISTASSGSHAWLVNQAINPIGVVTSAGAAVNNTASLYIGGASSSGNNNYALYVAAGNTHLNNTLINSRLTINNGTAVSGSSLHIGNATAFSTANTFSAIGFGLNISPNTYTSTVSSGSVATAGVYTFGSPTLAANNNTTLTNASSMYIGGSPIAGSNVTITNPYALYINAGNTYFGGNVQSAGLIAATSAVKTASYSVTSNDEIIQCNSTSGVFNITLQPSAPQGTKYTIENIDATANSVNIIGTINSATNYVLNAAKSITLYKTASGTNTWKIIASN